MRISDWSSDVCSSDLGVAPRGDRATKNPRLAERGLFVPPKVSASNLAPFIGGAAAKVNLESVLSGAMALGLAGPTKGGPHEHFQRRRAGPSRDGNCCPIPEFGQRSEAHTSELQSIMHIVYGLLC